MPSNLKRLLASRRLIFVVALSVRIVFGVQLLRSGSNPFRTNEPSHIAAHIATGQGFSAPYDGVPIAPTAQQPPGYPLVLAAVFSVFGVYSRASLIVIVAMSTLLGAAGSLLIFAVGSRHLSPMAGLGAAWMWAIWPPTASADVLLSNYTVSTIAVLLLLLVVPFMPNSRRPWVMLGLGTGVAALLNPMLLLFFFASVYAWLVDKPKQVLLAVFVAGSVLTPWILRNYVQMGHPYPMLRDNFGLELYLGNHAGMEVDPQPCSSSLCEGTANYNHADFPATEPHLFSTLGESAFMERKEHDALAYMQAQPKEFLIRTLKRAGAFWLLPNPLANAIALSLSIVGVFRSSRSFRRFVLVVFVTYPVVFYITQITWVVGYRHPLEPLIFLLFAAAITWHTPLTTAKLHQPLGV